ncbi:MAG TPA: 23S rRNA (adenine(2503)-C(2))-methyltransferase RlmN [Bacilli bacterium]|nr:23S rRNA (adenine(2503)-C(2))-methyltransferase RlmN [Bacilli bacterium]
MNNIFNYKLSDLEDYFGALGEKKFKARQIYDWLYKKQVYDFKDMTNIKKDLIDKLAEDFNTDMIKIVKKQEDKTASKYLFKLFDDNYIEAVLMYHDYGISVCVSSQVGCNMGCKFCESGRLKKVRNLETYEMVEQILLIEQDIKQRISSVVIMGIGEPFDNYNNVLNFIKIINSDLGIAIGARHITVSTCGLIPKIKEFSNENIQVNLAVSLHAPNNDLRNKIMPINKAYPLNDLIVTLKEYIKKTNRRVTIEYVILDKVNDSRENALELANLLKGMNVYVNLIPYNETNNLDFKKSDRSNILKFYDTLKKQKINVTIRKEFGANIDGACGQLRSKEVD